MTKKFKHTGSKVGVKNPKQSKKSRKLRRRRRELAEQYRKP